MKKKFAIMLSVFFILVAQVFAESGELAGKSFDGVVESKCTFTFTDAKNGTVAWDNGSSGKFTYMIDSTAKEIVMRLDWDGEKFSIYGTYSLVCLKCRFEEQEFLLLRKW